MKFFDSHTLTLTPLSPIHIGCGEDYDPTGYVTDDGRLWAFDPARLPLNDAQRAELMGVLSGDVSKIAHSLVQFYRGHLPAIREIATHSVALSTAAFGGAEIARTSYALHSQKAYLPGSSFKGALRTAILDERFDGWKTKPNTERADQLERTLAEGQFATDPLRLLKIADSTGAAETRIYCQVNRYKKASRPGKAELDSQLEVIAPMQPGAFALTVQFQSLAAMRAMRVDSAKVPNFDAPDATRIAVLGNRFAWREFARETQEPCIRPLLSTAWLAAMQEIRTCVDTATPTAFLLRVGKHCGAESLTIEGTRRIRIHSWAEPEAHTVWLAAETRAQKENLLPFGWVLCEFGEPSPQLRAIVEQCSLALKPALPLQVALPTPAAPPPPPALDFGPQPATTTGRNTYALEDELKRFAKESRRIHPKRDQSTLQRTSNLLAALPRCTPEERSYLSNVLAHYGPLVFDTATWASMSAKLPASTPPK